MVDEPSGEPTLPYACPWGTGEPSQFSELRSGTGIDKLPTSTGDSAWLVTNYDGVRAMCNDLRVGKSHVDPPHAPRLWDAALMEPQSGHADEFTDHTRWRHALSRPFSSRRLSQLRPRLEILLQDIVTDRLADGPPVDVCAGIAQPFAATVICDLLGIPQELRPALVQWSDAARTYGMTEAATARRDVLLREIDAVLKKIRDQPDGPLRDSGLLSDFALTPPDSVQLQDDKLARAILDIFLAGYDTVATRMSYGTAFLLDHPEQLAELRDDPSLLDGAVEEIFRLAVPGGGYICRYAHSDMPLPDAPIKAGDLIVLSFQSANRDEQVFIDATRFDVRRRPNPHIAFGHGTFYCLGAALARLELSVYLAGLSRFPALRRAHPTYEHDLAHDKVTGGLRQLLIAWDTPSA
ncbi:cytochrome P450 [Streptomyces sp. NPDC085937]|uniref:cytochrome P450 n=1 Tax=Streptomyces sp. NPDC085937 TaxID=3365742 RepID=UPI0037D0CD6F